MEDPGYIDDPERVRVIPGAVDALRHFRDVGFALVLVTNQSGIGRGYYGWTEYDAVASRLREYLAAAGLAFDAELACGHPPERDCSWRKPAPGMIVTAARQLDLDLQKSILAGDKGSDIAAAVGAGLPRAAHVLTGHGRAERAGVVAFRSSIRVDLLDGLGDLRP